MSTPLLVAIAMALGLGFIVGGVAVWQAGQEAPLPDVRLTAPFHPDEGYGGLNDEYISVTNAAGTPIDLSGWILTSSNGNTYTFPEGTILDVDAVVTVYSGCAENERDALNYYWCSNEPVWQNTEGVGTLRAPDGTLVDWHSYDTLCEACAANKKKSS